MSKLLSSGSELSTSRSLLLRLRGDDPAAWEQLVSLYGPLIYGWCRRSRLQDADVADVFQEVFRAVARRLPKFRKERPGDTFRGWVRTITRNKVIDHYRRLDREPRGGGGTVAQQRLAGIAAPGGDDSPFPPTRDDDDRRQLLHQALSRLRIHFQDRTWEAFWRTTVDDCPATEVAEELSMSPGAVRVAKCRVLQRLRAELGDLL